MFWLPVVVLAFSPAFPADKPMPAQAARGKAFFLDASQKNRCGTCHEIDKSGTAVGPNLLNLARLSPRAIEMSVMSSRTVYVKELELKTKDKMPVMVVSETPQQLTVYNVATTPPERLVLEKDSIFAVRDNATWRHPPESTGVEKQQLADVIAFIRFVAYGDTKGVSVDELE